MKTVELTGYALDWAVAKCEGLHREDTVWEIWASTHQYSTDWALGGPIVERECISVIKNIGGSWRGSIRHTTSHPLTSHPVLAGWTNQNGQTPLIAAMRCYVASKLGDDVDVPEELK